MPLTKVQPAMVGAVDAGSQNVAMSSGVSMIEMNQTIASSYSITTGTNAISAGPITINNGITFSVPDGSVWTVV